MTTNIVSENSIQANKVTACEQLHALALYASAGHDVVARALETVKPLLPNETVAAVDAILDAQAMARSEWCVSAKEVA